MEWEGKYVLNLWSEKERIGGLRNIVWKSMKKKKGQMWGRKTRKRRRERSEKQALSLFQEI